MSCKSSNPEVFLGKGVPKICSKFTGEHPCRGVIYNFIEISLQHGYSPVNLLHIFRAPFSNNTSGWLPLKKYLTYKSKNYLQVKELFSDCRPLFELHIALHCREFFALQINLQSADNSSIR